MRGVASLDRMMLLVRVLRGNRWQTERAPENFFKKDETQRVGVSELTDQHEGQLPPWNREAKGKDSVVKTGRS